MPAADQNTIAPGGVVPFKIPVQEGASRFRTWINRKWFCPKLAKESAKPDSFHGVYLPYWTYDTQTYSDFTARYGYRRTRTRNGKTETYYDWHRTAGNYREFIDDQIVLASKNHNAGILKQLQPFNTADNKVYKP